jgi:SAM-dependent methyltransferase
VTDAPVRDYRAQVASIRRSRLHPRRSDYLYLHLRRLRDDLDAALAELEVTDVLDVYCGARPYEPLLRPGTRYVGFDIDDAFGCADVVSEQFLPFPDASFDLCLCTQAFYFVPDPASGIAELARVLRPGGHALLTLPVVYPGTERLYSELQLRELFGRWDDVVVVENGGTVVSIATLSCFLLHRVEKRAPRAARRAFDALYVVLNVTGEVADRLETRYLRSGARLPANLLVRAKRPAAEG